MRSILIGAALALAAACASADMVATDGDNSLRLMDTPCALPIPQAPGMKAAVAVIDGKTFTACWMPFGQQVALLY